MVTQQFLMEGEGLLNLWVTYHPSASFSVIHVVKQAILKRVAYHFWPKSSKMKHHQVNFL
jgi:hypothetical protein